MARRTPPRKVTYFEPLPPRLISRRSKVSAANMVRITTTYAVRRRCPSACAIFYSPPLPATARD
jgi:hypothetical protein